MCLCVCVFAAECTRSVRALSRCYFCHASTLPQFISRKIQDPVTTRGSNETGAGSRRGHKRVTELSVLIGGHQRGTPEEIKNRDEGGRVRVPGHQVRGRLDLKHLSL